MKTRSWQTNSLIRLLLTGAALVNLEGCGSRFSECERDLSCGSGGSSTGGQGTGSSSTGGGNLGGGGSSSGGGGGTGTGGTVDPCDACTGETPFCNSDKECVACLENSACTEPTKSVCGSDGSCEKCVSNDDCAHLDDRTVCDGGTCVECTIETEAAKCGGKSCNPATKTCTNTNVGTRTRCKSCVADSECETNYRCVPMEFNGVDRDGGYCLKAASSPGGCSQPYTVPTALRGSLSGAAGAQYCGINEAVTTCEALLDLGANKDCVQDSDCGAADLDDARCETVSFVANKCTYSCVADNGCPATFACGTVTNEEYCGGPTM